MVEEKYYIFSLFRQNLTKNAIVEVFNAFCLNPAFFTFDLFEIEYGRIWPFHFLDLADMVRYVA